MLGPELLEPTCGTAYSRSSLGSFACMRCRFSISLATGNSRDNWRYDAALIVGLPGLSVGIIFVVFHNYAWYMEGVQRSIDSSPRYFNTIDGITSVPITFDFFVLRIAVHRTKIVPFCCFRLRFLADFFGPNGAVGGVRFGELPIEKCFGIFSGGKPVCS